jgi:hypothetical protein
MKTSEGLHFIRSSIMWKRLSGTFVVCTRQDLLCLYLNNERHLEIARQVSTLFKKIIACAPVSITKKKKRKKKEK